MGDGHDLHVLIRGKPKDYAITLINNFSKINSSSLEFRDQAPRPLEMLQVCSCINKRLINRLAYVGESSAM